MLFHSYSIILPHENKDHIPPIFRGKNSMEGKCTFIQHVISAPNLGIGYSFSAPPPHNKDEKTEAQPNSHLPRLVLTSKCLNI